MVLNPQSVIRNLKRAGLCFSLLLVFFPSLVVGEDNKRGSEQFPILTPESPQTPQIHGLKVFGVRPGSPFRFQIPATGERPVKYSASNLPAGLHLDDDTGRIQGVIESAGRYLVRLHVANGVGATERELLIICGDRIALTPPLGWNSWNCWGASVTQDKVLRAARALVATGLQQHGWTYVNIDDGWQGKRDGSFNAIQGNANFPDIASLVRQVHEMGLKVGIYSTPWRTSYAWHIGSSADNPDGTYDWLGTRNANALHQYQFQEEETVLDRYALLKPVSEWFKNKKRKRFKRQMRTFGKYSFVAQDAAQWAAWEIDYLKYDWSPNDTPHAREMSNALMGTHRDIVYSLANNANRENAGELAQLSNSTRKSADLQDNWESVNDVGFSQDSWASLTRPGHYNDPDMLVLGLVGWGEPRPTRLTADEQYSHMSLWCLLSAPLLLGCDLERLDAFTVGLITNDEVIEVNQDPLCKQATRVAGQGDATVYAKPLEDGSIAVGLFNRSESESNLAVTWSELGINGRQTVRDLWRQKDLGAFTERFEAPVSRHGVVLVRVTKTADRSSPGKGDGD